MRYDNTMVRRQDRLLSEERASELLREGEYGVLAIASAQGGYGVPMNYAVDEKSIYLHCAPDGHKLRAIEHDARVTFCVVGRVEVVPHEFTTQFESVIATGVARVVEADEERRIALRLILQKYASEHLEEGLRAIERSIARTAIIAIDVDNFSGKTKMMR